MQSFDFFCKCEAAKLKCFLENKEEYILPITTVKKRFIMFTLINILMFVIFCLLSVICKQLLLHVNSYTCTFDNHCSLTQVLDKSMSSVWKFLGMNCRHLSCENSLVVRSRERWLYLQAYFFSYFKII